MPLRGEARQLPARDIATLAEKQIQASFILDRAVPPRKDRAVTIDLPPLATAADAVIATSSIIAAVAAGAITPDEGTALAGLVELHRRTIETASFEQRLVAVEARLSS